MKLNVYRGTKLSEALNMLDGKLPHKSLYWITDKSEAEFYAYQNKLNDKNGRGSIVQAQLTLSPYKLKQLSHEEYNNLETITSKRQLSDKIAVYETDQFKVFLIPPKLHSTINNIEVEKVV